MTTVDNTDKVVLFVDWRNQPTEPPGTGPATERPPIWEPDTNNATHIRYDKDCNTELDYNKWKKLDQYNSGFKTLKWENKPLTRYLYNMHLIEALASQLDLSKPLAQRAYGRFMGLNLNKWGRPASLVAFCVCALTVHQDERCTNRSYHPNQKPENRDRTFENIRQSLALLERDVSTVYGKLEAHYRSRPKLNTSHLQFERMDFKEGYINGEPFYVVEEFYPT